MQTAYFHVLMFHLLTCSDVLMLKCSNAYMLK